MGIFYKTRKLFPCTTILARTSADMLLLMYFNNGFAMIHGVQQTPRRRSLLARQTQGLPLRVKEGEMSPNNRLKHECFLRIRPQPTISTLLPDTTSSPWAL